MDLLVRWRYPKDAASGDQKEQRVVLELKTIRERTPADRVLTEGLEQAARYAAQSGAMEVHLVICDERPGQGWNDKIHERSERSGDFEIMVWGM